MQRTLAVSFLILCFGWVAFAQDEALLKQRVQVRANTIEQLLSTGLAREGAQGLLEATGALDGQQSQLLQAENNDRKAIFALISKRTAVPAEEVARMYTVRAARKPQQIGYASCKLVPAKDADTLRLLQYLKQGMNYASQKKFESALAEFQQALTIDKNFLGLEQNVGSSQLALRKYAEAETAFKSELKLVDCLSELNANQLAAFGYFMEVDEKEPVKRRQAQTEKLKQELPKVKATAHYNLACVYARQGMSEQALAELRTAVDSGFSDTRSLNSDPDLAPIRNFPQFRQILASVRGKSN